MSKLHQQLNSLDELAAKVEKEAAKIKQGIQALLLEQPDNPRINRVGKGCFTIMSGDLGDNWSAFYHDFKAQYEMIALLAGTRAADKVRPLLEEIVEKQRIKNDGATVRFHPDVCAKIKELINE